MNIFIPLGLFLVLITFALRNNTKSCQKAFLFSFLAMFAFAALRYNFGPDYYIYSENFLMLKSLGIDDFMDYNQHSEAWFVHFLNLFNSFFVFIIAQSFIWLVVSYFFLKNNVPSQYYFVVILVMFFNISFSLLNFTAIRSSLAGCFFFVALMIITSSRESEPSHRKGLLDFFRYWKLVIYLLLVYAGSQFHTSVILFLIFPFITRDRNISKQFSNNLLVLGIVLAVLSVTYRTTFTMGISLWIIDSFPSSFERYENYLEMLQGGGGGLGALLFNMMRIVILYPILHALTVEKESRYLRMMQFAAIFLYSFLLINENLLSRYTMCFYPVIVVALLRSCKYVNKDLRLISILSILLLSIFQFYTNINLPSYASFKQYHTIFTAPYWM